MSDQDSDKLPGGMVFPGLPKAPQPDPVNASQLGGARHDIFFAAVQTTRMPMIVTDPHQPDRKSVV